MLLPNILNGTRDAVDNNAIKVSCIINAGSAHVSWALVLVRLKTVNSTTDVD